MKYIFQYFIIITRIEHNTQLSANPNMESQKVVCTCLQNTNTSRLLTEATKFLQLVQETFTELKKNYTSETNTRLIELLNEYGRFSRKLYSNAGFYTCTTEEEQQDTDDSYYGVSYMFSANLETKCPYRENPHKRSFRCDAAEARIHFSDLQLEIEDYYYNLNGGSF